jgi:glycosyltransferase involved in cell wall biosynthesis
VPVIVTDYGGHTDYVNNGNGYLIEVEKFVNVYDPVFFPHKRKYGVWAQPNLDHMAQIMRYVTNHRAEIQAKGARARKDVVENWTWNHAAEKSLKVLGL